MDRAAKIIPNDIPAAIGKAVKNPWIVGGTVAALAVGGMLYARGQAENTAVDEETAASAETGYGGAYLPVSYGGSASLADNTADATGETGGFSLEQLFSLQSDKVAADLEIAMGELSNQLTLGLASTAVAEQAVSSNIFASDADIFATLGQMFKNGAHDVTGSLSFNGQTFDYNFNTVTKKDVAQQRAADKKAAAEAARIARVSAANAAKIARINAQRGSNVSLLSGNVGASNGGSSQTASAPNSGASPAGSVLASAVIASYGSSGVGGSSAGVGAGQSQSV